MLADIDPAWTSRVRLKAFGGICLSLWCFSQSNSFNHGVSDASQDALDVPVCYPAIACLQRSKEKWLARRALINIKIDQEGFSMVDQAEPGACPS